MPWQLPAPKAVLCGTYKKDLDNLHKLYDELITTGCQILSPHSLSFVTSEKGFQKTVHETKRSFEELERHHLCAIAEADLVWLHAPDGYVGNSAAMEIGFAIASDTPIFSRQGIDDPAIEPFINICNSVFDALYKVRTS